MKAVISDQKYTGSPCFVLEEEKLPLKFPINTFKKNKYIIRTENNPINYQQEYKSRPVEKTRNKSSKRDEINKLLTFEEILEYGINAINLKDSYFFDRILELKEICDSDEDDDLSLESLKTMFFFVEAIGNISKPSSLTVSESGLFYLEWERDVNNSITVRFKKDYFLDYVIFESRLDINEPRVLNGSMDALDFIDYLNDLNLKIHQQV